MQSDWNWKCIQEKVRWIAQFEIIRDDMIWCWLVGCNHWLVERNEMIQDDMIWWWLVVGWKEVSPTSSLLSPLPLNAASELDAKWQVECIQHWCKGMNATLWIPYWNEFTTLSLLTLAILLAPTGALVLMMVYYISAAATFSDFEHLCLSILLQVSLYVA